MFVISCYFYFFETGQIQLTLDIYSMLYRTSIHMRGCRSALLLKADPEGKQTLLMWASRIDYVDADSWMHRSLGSQRQMDKSSTCIGG